MIRNLNLRHRYMMFLKRAKRRCRSFHHWRAPVSTRQTMRQEEILHCRSWALHHRMELQREVHANLHNWYRTTPARRN